MAGETDESTATLTAPATPREPVVESDEGAEWRKMIVHSDDPDPDDESQPDAQVAPDAGHPKEPKAPDAPASGTPTDGAGADGAGTETPTKTPEADTHGEDATSAEPKDEEAAILAELLGITETEPDNSPVWKERHSEATRALHEARGQIKQFNELLRQYGRQIVTTKDGFGISPTEDAKDFDPNEIDLPSVVKELSQDDLDRLADNPLNGAMVIAKKLAQEFAKRVPPITARPQDAILSERESQQIWQKFVDAKLSNGKPRHPDATNPETMQEMERAYSALSPDLCERAERDPHVLEAVQELCYLRVFRMRQIKVALAKHRAAKVAEQNQENKKGVAVTGSGSETAIKAQTDKGAPETGSAEWYRQLILSADK